MPAHVCLPIYWGSSYMTAVYKVRRVYKDSEMEVYREGFVCLVYTLIF